MESPNYSPSSHSHLDAIRPSLGFPLGTALLLLVIFSLSGIFSCCYHWDKLRSFRRSFPGGTDLEADFKLGQPNLKQNQKQSLTVLMPGDQIPKFIAMPCPCQPPRLENIVVELPMKLPKPPPPTPALP